LATDNFSTPRAKTSKVEKQARVKLYSQRAWKVEQKRGTAVHILSKAEGFAITSEMLK